MDHMVPHSSKKLLKIQGEHVGLHGETEAPTLSPKGRHSMPRRFESGPIPRKPFHDSATAGAMIFGQGLCRMWLASSDGERGAARKAVVVLRRLQADAVIRRDGEVSSPLSPEEPGRFRPGSLILGRGGTSMQPSPPHPPSPAASQGPSPSRGARRWSASVVSRRPLMEAAFCRALRVTLVGSTTPAFTRSSYSPVATL